MSSVNALRRSEQIRKWLGEALSGSSGPVLVHSDLGRAVGAVAAQPDRSGLLGAHTELLLFAAGRRPVWMPAFTYDFTRSHRFDVARDASQVGALTEHFRTAVATWRSEVPVFSISGVGAPPLVVDPALELDPFGRDSLFGELARRGGSIVLYGAGLSSCTFVHHVERMCGGPTYRYDKRFSGAIVSDSRQRECVLNYHVRPWGRHLEYDWGRLIQELDAAGISRRLETGGFRATVIGAEQLMHHWQLALQLDPLHLLDRRTRAWVAPELERLGRRFALSDFEET